MAGIADEQVKQKLFFLAKLAEQVERYDDMFDYAEQLVSASPALTFEEQTLFSSASMNIISPLRKWYGLNVKNINLEPPAKKNFRTIIEKQNSNIIKRISDFCKKVLNILDTRLIPSVADDKKSMVFYLTMKGDFYRYMGEVSMKAEREKVVESGKEAYVAAGKIAKDFETLDATRLGVALNYAVFHYTILNDTKGAIKILTEGFEEANVKLDDLSLKNGKYEDSTALVLGLMKENLDSWEKEVLSPGAKGESVVTKPKVAGKGFRGWCISRPLAD